MKKDLIVALCSCFVLVGINLSIQAQNVDQGELKGPVRRVRVETVDILVKNGNLVEGPRVLREIATYDQKGVKIDSVSHAREQTTPLGQRQYRHDDKGNIVEMVLIGEDGSIVGKELYKYEFDELGNWKRKTSAIAVYENGTLKYEPIEITYRTIAYYYAQAVDKLASAVAKAHASGSFMPTESASKLPPTSKMPSSDTATTTDSANSTREDGARSSDSKVTNAGTNGLALPVGTMQEDQRVGEYGSAVKSEARTPASPLSNAPALVEKPTLKHVSEKTLRDAAINLPLPDYRADASRERAARKVEVQIVVDEEGLVGSAHVISGNSEWNDAAERAARKARFLPAKLSSDSAKVFGIISYDFAAPASTTPSIPSSTMAVETSPGKPPIENKSADSDENPSAVPSSEPSPTLEVSAKTTASLKPAVPSHYETGLKYLEAGRYSDAVAALKQSVQLNPNDAISYVKLGMAHVALSQYKEAVEVFKVAIRIQPEVVDGVAFYRLGYAYSALEKPSDALQAFKRALYITRAEAADPTDGKATNVSLVSLHYNLGLAYHNLKRYDSAIKEWTEAIKLNPKAAEAYYGLGMAYLALNNTRSARKQEAALRSFNLKLANQLNDAISVAETIFPCKTLNCAIGRR